MPLTAYQKTIMIEPRRIGDDVKHRWRYMLEKLAEIGGKEKWKTWAKKERESVERQWKREGQDREEMGERAE